jgi:hypothetical protein
VAQQRPADAAAAHLRVNLAADSVVAAAIGVVDHPDVGEGHDPPVELPDHDIHGRVEAGRVVEPLGPLLGRLALIDVVRDPCAGVHLRDALQVVGQPHPPEQQSRDGRAVSVQPGELLLRLRLRLRRDHAASSRGLR